MYKAIVSLENEVDHLKQKTNIITANSDLNNYYTKSEIDNKLNDISGANLSNYVQFGENSTDEGIILVGKTQRHFKTILNQQSLEITDGSLISKITDSQINFTNKNAHNFRIAVDTLNDEADLVIGDKMNILVGSSTLAITQDDVTFKGQSLLSGGSGSGNYIINGENNGNVNIATNNSGSISFTSGTGGINISGGGGSVNIASVSSNGINLTSQGSTLAITQDDVTFKGNSLLSGVSGNYVINGENNNGVNITTDNTNNISLSAEGTGELHLSSKYSINLRANTSRFVVTPDDVTFNDSSFIVNGTNNKNINIKTGDGNSIKIEDGNDNIIDFASIHGIKLTSGGSTLNITADDVTFKNQSLIVDTSNFVINGANNKAVHISTDTDNNINLTAGKSELIIASSNNTVSNCVNMTSYSINIKASSGGGGAGINLTSGSSTLKIMFNDITFKGSSLIVDTSNFVINGENGYDTDVNITGKTINLKASGDAVLAIRYDDISFKGQSLIVDTSNFIVNGTNNKDINITTGIGYIKLSSDNSINLSVNNSTLAITSTDVTFKGQSLINNSGGSSPGGNYVVNGNNSGAVNITSPSNINITSQGNSGVNITTGSLGFRVNSVGNINLSTNSSTLAITESDVTFKGQSLIVDTSNFIVNGINSYPLDITTNNVNITANSGVMGQSINLTAGASTLAISQDDITFKGSSLIVDTSNFVINGENGDNVNINVSNNIYLKTSEYNNGEIRLEFPQYSTMDMGGYISISRYSLNFLERGDNINFIMTSNTKAQKFIVCVGSDTPNEANSFIINESDVKFKNTSLVNPSATITHRAPIDENLTQNDFEIGKPVYMTGKVYVKDKSGETGWKHSESIDDVIDCISSVKHTGTWREYLGICVGKYKTRVGLEENEITFASHGDFMVKYSKCNVGDTLYVTDDGNINVLNDETPLTLKIQRQIVGLVTEKINDEYCAVFKSN